MPTAGQRILAADFITPVTATDSTVLLNVSGTPGTGSPEVGVTFTAPTSGMVMVTVGGSIVESGGGPAGGIIDYRIFEDNSSGAVVVGHGSLTRRAVLQGTTQSTEASRTSLITGLTPGQVYYAQMIISSYGTLVDFYNRTIAVYNA